VVDALSYGGQTAIALMTTANKITIFRVLLVPFFVVQVLWYLESGNDWHRLVAILTFGLAAASDGLDGYIARKYNQRSQLGAVLDPLADKLLLVSGIVLLSLDNAPLLPRTPPWLVCTIVGRDLLLLAGSVVIYFNCARITVRPVMIGKVSTVLQMTCVLWGLLKWHPGWLIVWSGGAAICAFISGAIYVREGLRQFNAHPRAAASPGYSH
jgi:CDP-diacylglycerol--glycerol-3-phosphate 3-phosphatidyltransferase